MNDNVPATTARRALLGALADEHGDVLVRRHRRRFHSPSPRLGVRALKLASHSAVSLDTAVRRLSRMRGPSAGSCLSLALPVGLCFSLLSTMY